MLNRFLLSFFILIFGLFFAFSSQAQITNEDIFFEINPKNPRAHQEVKITLSSRALNLNQTKIYWLLEGELLTSGIGKKEYVFRAPEDRKQTVFEVIVENIDGLILNKKITVLSSTVDLLWEAHNSYVPPFYKGRSLVSPEGLVKIVALANTSEILGYSYKWKLDGIHKTTSSGYGKNFYIFKNSYLDNQNEVEVTVADLLGRSVGSEKLNIKTVEPKIIFYKKDPSLGTQWGKALTDNFTIGNRGEILVAEPYFFSTQDLNSNDLSFKWFINGQEIENPQPKNILSLIKDSSDFGRAEIKLTINNIKTLFQKAEKTLNVLL